MSRYQFKGMSLFVESSAQAREFRDLRLIEAAKKLYPVKQVQDNLGQIQPETGRDSKAAMIEYVSSYRACLAIALDAIDAAIAEICHEFDIPPPAFLEDPDDAAGHLCGPDDPELGDDVDAVQNGRDEGHPRQPRRRKSRKG